MHESLIIYPIPSPSGTTGPKPKRERAYPPQLLVDKKSCLKIE